MKRGKSAELLLNNSKNMLQAINKSEKYKNDFCEYTHSQLKHKIFLQKLLHIIKITQAEFLTQISDYKKNHTLSNKIILNILKNLKSELIIVFKDKIQNKESLEYKANKNKSALIKNIFGTGKQNNNLKLVESKNEIKNYKYTTELPHLRSLNFRISNQLKYMDIKIKLISGNSNLFNPKNTPNYIYLFLDGKNDTSKAYNLLHDDLLSIRKKFTLIVKEKETQNLQILQLKRDIMFMQDKCGLNNKNEYVNTSDIINEESKEEYFTKTGVCTLENSKNNDILNKNQESKNITDCAFYRNELIRINDNV